MTSTDLISRTPEEKTLLQDATSQDQSSEPTELSLDDAIRYAMSLHRNQQLEGAEMLYRRILEHVPGQPDVLHHLGLARYQRGHPLEAIELIGAAVEQVPGFADYHANLANIYLSEGRLEEAMASCRQAIRLEPGRADFHNNFGVLLRALGQPQAAESAYRRAIELDPGHFRA